jgi:hypothetical protein
MNFEEVPVTIVLPSGEEIIVAELVEERDDVPWGLGTPYKDGVAYQLGIRDDDGF